MISTEDDDDTDSAAERVTTPALLIAPTNTAGQGAAWARAVTRNLGIPAESWSMKRGSKSIGFDADRMLDRAALTTGLDRKNLLHEIARRFSHVIVESATSPALDGGIHRVFHHAIAMRLSNGVNTAMLFHGSDIRQPSVHRRSHAGSPFHGDLDGLTSRLERNSVRRRRWMRFWPGRSYVSTADLLPYVSRASWLPVVADDEWFTAFAQIDPARARPRVLHLPSRRSLFQSDAIDAVCAALHDEGVIEYRSTTGIPPHEVRANVEWADIVIDKIGLGGYGVMTAQSMAAGRITVGDVDKVARDHAPSLPLVSTDAGRLGTTLRALLEDRGSWSALAQAGETFAREYHDGRQSATVLARFLR